MSLSWRARQYDFYTNVIELTPAALAAADCVLIDTDHSVFRWESIVTHCRLVLDTRNATHGAPNTAGVVVKL